VEYVFDVSSDRTHWHRIGVFVSDAALAPWSDAHRRELSSPERYGVAKIALRNAFDERPTPEAIQQRIAPGAAEVDAILDELDV
jgi:hypothetical protein